MREKESTLGEVLVGGNHLASALIGLGCMPNHYDTYDEVLRIFGQPAADMWFAWKAIMDLSKEIHVQPCITIND